MIGDEGVPDFSNGADNLVSITFENGPDGWSFSGVVIQAGEQFVDVWTAIFNFLS